MNISLMSATRIRLKLAMGIVVACVLIFSTFGVVWSWGFGAHRFINGETTKHLPPELTLFIENSLFLSEHSIDADLRKGSDPNEGPKHYIDIDLYPEFLSGTLSHDIDSLIATHGESTVNEIGVVPWATVWTLDTLIAALNRQDWNQALLSAADLGHYVGDAHQPLHVTKNFNGQHTGNDGIHSRYETTMLNSYLSTVVIVPSEAVYIEQPIDFIFQYIEKAYTRIDTILEADDLAVAASSGQYDDFYYQDLWQHLGDMTKAILQESTEDYANLLYTAAIDAGILSVTSTSESYLFPGEFVLHQNFPNPFNPMTQIQYNLPVDAVVRLIVYNLLGQEVATLLDGQQNAGSYSVSWDGKDIVGREVPSGIYFYRLRANAITGGQADNFSLVRKAVILR